VAVFAIWAVVLTVGLVGGNQVVTLDKSDLTKRLGNLDSLIMEQVDAGLRLALGL
jgi:mRNA-degrading endonuclease toxin of MazEF toxin-antitoxin module